MYCFFLWDMSVDHAGLHIFLCFKLLKTVVIFPQINMVAVDLQKLYFLLQSWENMKCHFEMLHCRPLFLARGALGCNYNPNLT